MQIRPDEESPLSQGFLRFFEEPFPLDLKIATAWLIIGILSIFLPYVNETPLRILFALPVILFLPGYVLIAALFPGKTDLDGIERIALSFGLSIAVVPLIGLALNYTPWGIRLDPIAVSLTIFTLAMIAVAHYRRSLLVPDDRFSVPFRAMWDEGKKELFPEGGSRLDRALSAILIIAIVAAVATTVFVIVVPKEGEKFTEFFILGEKKMAADYPDTLLVGEKYPMYIGIGNHEYRNVTYTAEVWFMQMDFDETTNTSSVSRMDRVDRFPVTLSHNETQILPWNLSAPATGYNRVEFLLFNETVAGSGVTDLDRINASYRDLHLWVTVR